jgi:Sulfotransferase domain
VGSAESGEADYITIVSGLPRSGTSMMMQMLAEGGISPLTDDLRRPDEDNPNGYFEFEAVKQISRDPSWLATAQGRVVKMVYRLLYGLPPDQRFRVVFMTRELSEVIASQEVMLRRRGKETGQFGDQQLTAVYRRQLGEVRRWLADQPNFEVVYVDYADVLQQPRTVADQLNAFLGGRLNVESAVRIPDNSLHRQRRLAAPGSEDGSS